MHEKLAKLWKCKNVKSNKGNESRVRDQREHKPGHDDASIATYAMTDLFKPLSEVGAQLMENQLYLEDWTNIGLFEKVCTLKEHKILHKENITKQGSIQIRGPEDFFKIVHEVTLPQEDTDIILEKLQANYPKLLCADDKMNESEMNSKPMEIVLLRVKKQYQPNAKFMAYSYSEFIPYQQLTSFYTKLLAHNSSCELNKHFRNNISLTSTQFDSILSKHSTKDTTAYTVSTCALRYVKMNNPNELNRNRIQVKYKYNEKNGLITIVENIDNPIDYVLLGKLMCHLLGIENINENKN